MRKKRYKASLLKFRVKFHSFHHKNSASVLLAAFLALASWFSKIPSHHTIFLAIKVHTSSIIAFPRPLSNVITKDRYGILVFINSSANDGPQLRCRQSEPRKYSNIPCDETQINVSERKFKI